MFTVVTGIVEVSPMSPDVAQDQFALIRIEGMHCHKCERSIQKLLSTQPGVREVEVDFNSGQASILFDRGSVSVAALMEAINDAGYHATRLHPGTGRPDRPLTPPPPDSPPTNPPTPSPAGHPEDPIDALLRRPNSERAREYKYRFAQAAVFGLPAIALQVFGQSLGGPEAHRWVAVFQAVLTGWVVYVGAAGMLFEGLLRLSRRNLTADLLPALLVVSLYLVALYHAAISLRTNVATAGLFHVPVLVLAPWVALRWWAFADPDRAEAIRNQPGRTIPPG
jgi:cation transport ATPase